MNNDNLFLPAYYLPFVALSARYKQDSGDGDGDFEDFIDDTIHSWLHQAHVTKFFDKKELDFTYMVEYEGKLIISCLGTEGPGWGPGWLSNMSPGLETHNFRDGHHIGFWLSGRRVFDAFYEVIKLFRDIVIIGHSRGAARAVAMGEMIVTRFGIAPLVIGYSGPPLHTRTGATHYNTLGIHTIRVINARDIVDDLGKPIFVHPCRALRLPFVRNRLNSIPLIGWLFGGHAYSSIFDGMIEYCRRRKMNREIEYLESRRSVATI